MIKMKTISNCFFLVSCYLCCFCVSVPTCETAELPQISPIDLDEMSYDVGELPEEGAVTMAFVFDVTGSMYDDLVQVIDGAAKILDTVLQRRERLLHNYVLVPFHDPEVGPATVTSDHRVFLQHLQDLYVKGGGDCPEASIAAIKLALEVCLPDSFIYVFTDASSKDYYLLQDVLTLIQRKQSQVVFVMTGDCGDPTHPGYQAYETIASTSSGQVFHLNKSDVDEVLNFVRVSLQARKVNLLAINQEEEGESVVPLVVDSNLREFTVSLSGDNPKVELFNPRGGTVEKHDGIKELLNISNVQIVNIKDPEYGTWNVKLSSNSSHTIRATGLSPIDFVYGFSVIPTSNLKETYHRPLKGAPTHLIINATDLAPGAYFDTVELISLVGESLLQVPLDRVQHQLGMFNATPFVPPEDYFYLKIQGFDELNFPMQRISPTAISSQLPGVPEVTLTPPSETHHWNTVTLICQIQSLVPFHVQWFRGAMADNQVGLAGNFSQTSTVNLTIVNITKSDEDHYFCNATNIAGSASSEIYLDVRDPPPRVRKLRDVSIVPESSSVFTCSATSESPFNLTWSRYDPGATKRRFTAELIRTNPRFKDYGNGTLVIRNAKKEDEGWYRCTARNEGGPAHQRMYVSVQKPPSITIHPKTEISYVEGSSMIVTCKSTGIPEPTVEWTRDGQLILESPHMRSAAGTLQLYRATRQEAGRYECRAQNAAGSDSQPLFLKFIAPPKIEKSQDVYTVISGDIVTLPCKVIVATPSAKVQWKRGDDAIPKRKPRQRVHGIGRGDLPADEEEDGYEFDDDTYELVDGSRLRFRPEMTDAVEYVCEASNEAGSDRHVVTVVVLVPPSILASEGTVIAKQGETLSLQCWTTGYPTPAVTWLKDGNPMPDDAVNRVPNPKNDQEPTSDDRHENLVVPNVGLSAAGLYTCVAKNKAGQATNNYTVIIHDPPKIDESNPSQVEAIASQDLLLSCRATGHPPPIISWQKNGVRLDLSAWILHHNGSMLLRSVQPSDTGIYTCTASNEAGYDNLHVNVTILVPPSVDRNAVQNRTEILAGNPITIECPVNAYPPPKISWLKDGRMVNENFGKESRFFIRNDGLSLIILKTQLEDAGNYTCVAANVAGQIETTLTLDVLAPPSFVVSEFSADVAVFENEPLHLDCWTVGAPKPNVTWTRDSQLLLPSNDKLTISDGGLEISRIQEFEAGVYTCRASNDVGTIERRFNVDVLVAPKLDDLDYETVQVAPGKSAEMSCSVKSNPMPSINWLKDDGQLGPETDANIAFKDMNQILLLRNVSKADAGEYVCEAHNLVGSISRTILLDVMEIPLIKIHGVNTGEILKVLKNEDVEAECVAEGNPPPSVSWVKDGITVTESRQPHLKLQLKSVDVYVAGQYRCIATNLAGHSEKDITIEVLVPPYLVGQENSSGQVDVQQVSTKLPLILHCPVEGKPLPKISWQKNGIPFSVVSDNDIVIFDGGKRLRIAFVTPEDAGLYTCIATNEAGRTEKEFNLDVLVPPTITEPERGVDIDSSTITASLKGEFLIQCPASGNPPPVITWLKDGVTLDSKNRSNVRFEDGFQKLFVSGVEDEDGGRYTCVATNTAGSAEKYFQVNVQHPPEFEIPVDKMDLFPTVQLNRPITLHCPAGGHPLPSIWWLKNGKPITDADKNVVISSDGRKLKLLHSRIEDRGSYTCLAYNDAGEIKVDFDLDVHVPPAIDQEKVRAKVNSRENDSITIECPVTGHPLPTITWLKDGKVLTSADSSNDLKFEDNYRLLVIRQISVVHEGQYTCVAANEAGVAEQNFKVNVQVPPKMDTAEVNQKPNVMINRPLMLICPVIGNPPPIIAWFKNGQPLHRMGDPHLTLSADGRRLKLRRARPEDAGVYKCVAYNDVGKTDQEFEIVVQVPPTFQSNGNDVDDDDHRTPEVIEGGTAEILCEVIGTPEPTIIWLKDGRLVGLLANDFEDEFSILDGNEIVIDAKEESPPSHIEIVHNGRLFRIHSVQRKDEGRYTCIASNVVGTTEKNFDLEILVPPKILGSKAETSRIYLNRPVILECPVEANPPSTITWFKDDRPLNLRISGGGAPIRLLDDGRRLQMVRALERDSGRYTCVATNSVGKAEKHYDLSVLVPPTITVPTSKVAATNTGQNITLECQATGHPQPQFLWFKDAEVLEETEDLGIAFEAQNRHLIVKNVTVAHAGRYTCMASNEAGASEKDVNLYVTAPPSMVQLPPHQRSLSVLLNQPIKLECPLTSSKDIDIKWLKNGLQVDTAFDPFVRVMSDGRVLQLFRARQEDAGHYQCVASNTAGHATSDFHLQILVRPKIDSPVGDDGGPSIVLEHRTADFECFVSGNPFPVVSWLKDGEVLENTVYSPTDQTASREVGVHLLSQNQHLRIPNAQVADTGQYTCIATSSSGSSQRDFYLAVQVPPQIDPSVPKNVTAISHHPITLQCPILKGVPEPTITWIKQGVYLETFTDPNIEIVNKGRKLNIKRSKVTDSGTYICLSSNSAGKDNVSIALDVQVPPQIDRSNFGGPTTTAVAQSTLVLECSSSGHPQPIISWYKDDLPVIRDSGDENNQILASETVNDSSRFQILSGGQKLRIATIEVDDEGTYECVAVNSAGHDRAQHNVDVLVPPTIDLSALNGYLRVAEGESITVPCPVTGDPIPNIVWLKEGQIFDPIHHPNWDGMGNQRNGHRTSLYLAKAQGSDGGRYTCVATNQAGDTEVDIDLEVLVPPSILSTPVAPDVQIIEGYSLILECQPNGNPLPHVSWLVNGSEIPVATNNADGSSLQLLHNSQRLRLDDARFQNSGQYTCVAKNSVGDAKQNFDVKVMVPPRFNSSYFESNYTVLLNEDVTLACPVTGFPQPRISWYKESQLLLSNGHIFFENGGTSLTLSKVRLLDKGRYVCLATNDAGTSEANLILDVLVPPTIDGSTSESELRVVIVHQPVTLECFARGVPHPTLTWYKNDEPLVTDHTGRIVLSEDRSTLKIVRSILQDEDVYTCLAENDAGVTERDYRLDILVPPGINLPQPLQSLQVVTGHPLKIECPVVGDPPPMVTWLKQGQQVIASGRLSILKDGQVIYVEFASPTDGGDYTCLASNEAGNSEQEFIVLVQVPPIIKDDNTVDNVSVIAYHSFRLECPASGNPFPTIQWMKDGRLLNISTPASLNSYAVRWTSGPILQVNRALPNHSGIYLCEATNAAGSAHKSYNVSVWRPPRFLNNHPSHQEISSKVNEEVTLSCLSEGHPQPQTVWFKDEQPLLFSADDVFRHGMQELLLSKLNVTDSGDYRCIATNVAGNVSKDFTLDVMELPTIENAPNAHVRVKLNERVDLSCQATGNPVPRIKWSRVSPSFSETGLGHHVEPLGSTLTFPSARLHDEGTYMCTATNDAGMISYNITLEVQIPPSIAEAPSHLAVNRGSQVTIPCLVKGRPLPTVTWKKDSELIDNALGYTILPSGSLSFSSVQLSHTGMYACMAYNDAGTKQVQRHLRVHVPSRITPNQTEKYVVIRGNDATLDCLNEGHPTPHTVWERNGEPVDLRHPSFALLSDGGLRISAVSSSDSGTYRCVAQNSAGSDVRDVELLIMIPPKIAADSNDDRYVVMKGSPIRLPCHATGYPLPSVSWLRNGIEIPTNSSRDLYLDEAKVEDSGKYVCMVANEAGRDLAEKIVEVIVPPTIVSPPLTLQKPSGELAQFTCSVDGLPAPTVTWFHNAVPILGSSASNGISVLTLKMIQTKDAGVYTCTAKNPGGEKRADALLTVLVPPKIVRPPEDYTVPRGSSVILSCNVEGDPYPSIFWTKNGQQLDRGDSTNDDGWLAIVDVQPTDAGTYKCIATNGAGVAEASGVVTVLVEPQLIIEPRDSVVDLGTSSVLDCRAEGNPLPSVQWSKDSILLSTSDKQKVFLANSSLQLVAVQLSDEGTYECTATSPLGTASSKGQISVRVHGSWSTWSTWGSCSTSCGAGVQTRQRLCNNPPPRHDGQSCVGPAYENHGCTLKPCPVDGSWSQWREWSTCSVTCGRGIKLRVRKCDAPKPSAGGQFCSGDSREAEACLSDECPVDGNWGGWTAWTTCSVSCGEGVRIRSRLCDEPSPRYGGQECEGASTDSVPCNVANCEVDGKWSPWTEWSQCSQSCGGGIRERRRVCDSPAPSNGGRNCSGQAVLTDYCHNDPCPVHGNWASWSEWGECSASCGGGQRRRFRTCNNPSPKYGGRTCAGPGQDTEACNTHQCPEHGNWATWSEWSSCTASCAGGVRQRYRSCTNPPPRFGGRRCSGDDSQEEQCARHPCQVLPVSAVGHLLGVINGQDIGLSPIFASAIQLETQTTIVATIGNIPDEAGNWLRVLPSLLSPIYWAMAYEMSQAANGYRLTKGYFLRDSQVTFTTGEEVKMTHVGRGLDGTGSFLVDVVISGDVPELPPDEDIILDEYTEDYVQTGPDTLHAMSTRTFRVNDYTLPYAWNHSIRYDEVNGRMPYLVQRLHVDGIGVDYNRSKNELHFIFSAVIDKGSPSNKCPDGFSLHVNGLFCDDTNECLQKNLCSHGCSNTPGSYLCFCPPGYILGPDGQNCQDLDECLLGMDDCLQTTECENTIGSYRCLTLCMSGFQRTISGLGCEDINECSEQPRVCDQLCVNLIGGYRCDCTTGYRLIGLSTCKDIDECEKVDSPCSDGCINTPGSYVCTCPKGFTLIDNGQCEDDNECLNGNHNCRAEQECQNTPGSYKCIDLCKNGYTLHSNGSCVDTDECRLGKVSCHVTQLCENTVGSYRCICPRGFQSSSSGQPCQDYNECASDGRCQHRCENTVGSYRCICPKGYQLNSNGRTCQDVDECIEEEVNCGRDKICFNTRGSFQCVDAPCPPLFDRDQDTGDCVLPCDRSDVPCAAGVKYAEILSYKMVSLASGIQAYEDLVRLVAYDQDGQPMRNTEFSVVENNSGVPFQIRRESGKGILYTLKSLDPGREYSAVILATSYGPFRTVVHYTTKFLVFISVAEFPY